MRGRDETLAIPTAIRTAVDERDQGYCRVCGKFLGLERRALHHVLYGRGMGARRHHEVGNLITVCWLWPGNCHDRVHGEKLLWQPLLLDVIARPGLTALQLRRWRDAKK